MEAITDPVLDLEEPVREPEVPIVEPVVDPVQEQEQMDTIVTQETPQEDPSNEAQASSIFCNLTKIIHRKFDLFPGVFDSVLLLGAVWNVLALCLPWQHRSSTQSPESPEPASSYLTVRICLWCVSSPQCIFFFNVHFRLRAYVEPCSVSTIPANVQHVAPCNKNGTASTSA